MGFLHMLLHCSGLVTEHLLQETLKSPADCGLQGRIPLDPVCLWSRPCSGGITSRAHPDKAEVRPNVAARKLDAEAVRPCSLEGLPLGDTGQKLEAAESPGGLGSRSDGALTHSQGRPPPCRTAA